MIPEKEREKSRNIISGKPPVVYARISPVPKPFLIKLVKHWDDGEANHSLSVIRGVRRQMMVSAASSHAILQRPRLFNVLFPPVLCVILMNFSTVERVERIRVKKM